MLRRFAFVVLASACALAASGFAATSEALPGGGLPLRLERELRLSSAPAPASAQSPSALLRILIAVLSFLVANVAVLLASSVAMRLRRERGEQRSERFRTRWEALLHMRIAGDAAPLPPLAPSERLMFLALWLQLHDYVRGEAADALAQYARELDLPQYVLRLLEARAPWTRILAMRAAAALRLAEAGDILYAKAMQAHPKSSAAAARALLAIDTKRGLTALAHVLRELEWSPAAMAEIVKAGGSGAGAMLAREVRAASPGAATQLTRLIEYVGDPAAMPALRERLLLSHSATEIASILHCLGRFGGAEDRRSALAFLSHGEWLVRMQAACALGTLGMAEDAPRLAPLLRDRNWWVRYRTAQALGRLAGAGALEQLRDGESDRYAREMLARVLAEGV